MSGDEALQVLQQEAGVVTLRLQLGYLLVLLQHQLTGCIQLLETEHLRSINQCKNLINDKKVNQ